MQQLSYCKFIRLCMPLNTALIDKVTSSPRKVFFIDAIGAIISALSLYVLVLPLNVYFGVPEQIILILGSVSAMFIGFSGLCMHFARNHDVIKLKIIIMGNLFYGVLTAALIARNLTEVTGLGIAYFVAEYSVIIALVMLEWECLKKLKASK